MEDTRFDAEQYIKTIAKKAHSKKTMKEFIKSKLLSNMIAVDPDCIIGKMVLMKYKNAITYWVEPDFGFAIELNVSNEQFNKMKRWEEENQKTGYIYLVQIDEHLFKFGRTTNCRKRLNQYPKGSKMIRKYFSTDMYEDEISLLINAAQSDGILHAGKEYYKFENEREAIAVFERTTGPLTCCFVNYELCRELDNKNHMNRTVNIDA